MRLHKKVLFKPKLYFMDNNEEQETKRKRWRG